MSSLDVVLASHPDADHIGGLLAVLLAYHPRFYLESPVGAESLIYGELQEAVGESVA